MEFCYLCGGPIMDGLHFKDWNCIFGCPDGQFTSDTVPKQRAYCWKMSCRTLLWPLMYALAIALIALAVAFIVMGEVLHVCLFVCCCPCLSVLLLKEKNV